MPDAERMMRSRYTAFVVGASAYLLATWYAGKRPALIDMPPGIEWLGLQVLAFRKTALDRAEVDFVARYSLHGQAARLIETSRFVREDGRWYYIDGDMR